MINLCKKVFGKAREKNSTLSSFEQPIILSRDQHPVSRKHISHNALKVLYRLNKGGFDAYLVGGGVRDILLGLEPKDFDIATNATPEQIKALFRNCRLIGRRFRLAHIVFGREIIEVATFRGHHDSDEDKNCQKTLSKVKMACCYVTIFMAVLKKMQSVEISPLMRFTIPRKILKFMILPMA